MCVCKCQRIPGVWLHPIISSCATNSSRQIFPSIICKRKEEKSFSGVHMLVNGMYVQADTQEILSGLIMEKLTSMSTYIGGRDAVSSFIQSDDCNTAADMLDPAVCLPALPPPNRQTCWLVWLWLHVHKGQEALRGFSLLPLRDLGAALWLSKSGED